MTRYLVTGSHGQLGTHLLAELGADAVGMDVDELDLTDPAAVAGALDELRPDVVLNAAAYTAVDAAEADSDAAFAVNADGPRLLASALARRGGRLVHVSTDYVFPGSGGRPYEPDDPTGPATVYGRSKLAGEQAALGALDDCLIIRTAWVYGGPGSNFVDTMRSLEQTRETVDVVADQVGSPTWVRDLARALIAATGTGVVHYVNAGEASWFELAREVFLSIGADPARVRPVSSDAFPRPAQRPRWSVLSTASWTSRGLPAPRPWPDALHEYLAG